MSYKDDLDAIAGGLKDTNKLTLNAITELDNAGKLGMYGGEGGGGETLRTIKITVDPTSPIGCNMYFATDYDGVLDGSGHYQHRIGPDDIPEYNALATSEGTMIKATFNTSYDLVIVSGNATVNKLGSGNCIITATEDFTFTFEGK